jgi:hypothetical protein
VLCNYEYTSKKDYREQQAAKRWVPLKENPYADERQYILEHIIMPMRPAQPLAHRQMS